MVWAANDLATAEEIRGADRYIFYQPATLRSAGEMPIRCMLINLSQTGFRVKFDSASLSKATVWLEVAGWPRIMAFACWQKGSTAGFMFGGPIRPHVFARMMQTASGTDREGGDILI